MTDARPIACTGKTGPHSLPLRRPEPPGATYELANTVQTSGATSAKEYDFECTISWREMFAIIAPYLVEHPNDVTVKLKLASLLKERKTGSDSGSSITINDQEFKTITIQLKAYGLVTTRYTQTIKGGMALFWSLTPKGEQRMIESRVIRGGA